jgi:hypothetical protein
MCQREMPMINNWKTKKVNFQHLSGKLDTKLDFNLTGELRRIRMKPKFENLIVEERIPRIVRAEGLTALLPQK